MRTLWPRFCSMDHREILGRGASGHNFPDRDSIRGSDRLHIREFTILDGLQLSGPRPFCATVTSASQAQAELRKNDAPGKCSRWFLDL